MDPSANDGGNLSYVKFNVPMSLVTTPEGLAQYESFLRFVCETLPVRGGYGGLSSILPYSFHRYMPQEWVLAGKFSGLEIDCYAFIEKDNYVMQSYEGESVDNASAYHPKLKPGAKVSSYGYIKGVNWYTLLGDVFVQRLGGEAALRSALAREDIGMERINQCVLVRAGPFPRLGAPEEGLPEPYVFVNSVLRVLRDPKHDALHSYIPDTERASPRDTLKWLARFDLPGAPPLPPTPTMVPVPRRASVPGGETCPEEGWWHTPAKAGSRRYFKVGELMPVIQGSAWGATFWQWDASQGS